MKPKNKLTEATIEAPIGDIKKLKATNSIAKDDVVKVIPDKKLGSNNNASVTTGIPMTEDIEPQDAATIKYLSNVKDANTGEVSKPFTIGAKKYQMIRGILPSKEIVMAVFCHDDLDEKGENIIHPMEYFEENIAKPMKENDFDYASQEVAYQDKKDYEELDQPNEPVKAEDYDYASQEVAHQDKMDFMDHLNLTDLVGFRHFFVNIKTGDVVAKFKTTKEMIKSGIKLGPDEDYMDVKQLKAFRFGKHFKNDVNEDDGTGVEGTDVPKLQADVSKLVDQIKKRFSVYLSKLDKPIEQAQFLTTMAQEIGVPLNKLSSIITQFRDIATTTTQNTATVGAPANFANENKIITKNDLIESVTKKNVIRTIKVKDIK